MKPFQSEAKASAQESKCSARETPYQEAKSQNPALHVAMTPCGRIVSAQTVRKLTFQTSQTKGKKWSREGLLL